MSARRTKILIIDDEEDFCYFMKENLSLIGNYEVITATRGRRGIWIAYWREPDLIILDIVMPGLNGFEVLKKLKKSKKTRSIPVIILTAKHDDESKVRASSLYNEEYIIKPVATEVLRSKIDNVLSRFGRIRA